jgi:hypothetical protein
MAAAEAKVDAKIRALNGLKGEVQGLLNQSNSKEAGEIDRLVKVFEGMKAKDAAPRLSALDDNVRIPIAAKMKERSLSAIIAQMPAADAKKLTESLARRFGAVQAAAAKADQIANSTTATPGQAQRRPDRARGRAEEGRAQEGRATQEGPVRPAGHGEAAAHAGRAAGRDPGGRAGRAGRRGGGWARRAGQARVGHVAEEGPPFRGGRGLHRQRRRPRRDRRPRGSGPSSALHLKRGAAASTFVWPRRRTSPASRSAAARWSPRRDGRTIILTLAGDPDVARLHTSPPKWIKAVDKTKTAGGVQLVLTLADNAEAKIGAADGATYVNVFEKAADPAAAAAPVEDAEAEPPASRTRCRPAAWCTWRPTSPDGQAQLFFTWQTRAGAAVFRRGDALWLVFVEPGDDRRLQEPQGACVAPGRAGAFKGA